VDNPDPNAEHKFCDMGGEDPTCADQYTEYTEWNILDHIDYMGY